MRKILAALAVVALAVVGTTGVGHAVDMAKGDYGLGFFDQNAPVGGIYWFSPKAALAVGLGIQKPDEGDTEFDITIGVPINLIGGSRANFQLRPRFFYGSNAVTNGNFMAIGADLAAEVFVTKHFSLLAGHGLEITTISPDEGDSSSNINSRVVSESSVGFYYYLQH